MKLPNSCSLLALLAFFKVEFSEGFGKSSSLKSAVHDIKNAAKPAKTMVSYVVPNGYPLEEYDVVTEDGYILGIYRIPHGRNKTSNKRPPIVLQHGIFASSSCFVMSIPEKSLAFVLADAGFDVWLSNSRGNVYSKGHAKLDPVKDAKKYYDYSFHELGYYDLPSVIDYILSKTENSQLYYIGHSQGTSDFYAMASARPEYNSKIKLAATLAPVAFMANTCGGFKFLSHFSGLLDVLREYFDVNVLLKNWSTSSIDLDKFPASFILPSIAYNAISLLAGYDNQQFNKSVIPIMLKQGSSGASTKQLKHYAQIIKSGNFSMFDYGNEENMKRYNQTTPPEYDLSKITAHVNLHYSANDWISRVPDVEKLNRNLPHSKLIEVPFGLFNHMDFLFAEDVNSLLYDNLIKMLKD